MIPPMVMKAGWTDLELTDQAALTRAMSWSGVASMRYVANTGLNRPAEVKSRKFEAVMTAIPTVPDPANGRARSQGVRDSPSTGGFKESVHHMR